MLTDGTAIIESMDDLEIWAYITAGFDFRGRLLMEHHFVNDENPHESYIRTAIIDSDDAATAAKNLCISPEDLPDAIREYAGSFSSVLDVSTVDYAFKEILLYLIENGARYKLECKYGEQ